MHPTRVCQNSLVVHGDLFFYVIAQTCLSLLFFGGLTLLASRQTGPCMLLPGGFALLHVCSVVYVEIVLAFVLLCATGPTRLKDNVCSFA